MSEIITAFTITRWDQVPFDEPAEGPALTRAEVDKTYSGALDATSVAQLVLCGELSYSAVERVTGTLDGRAGSFVLAHGATGGVGAADAAPGVVVPGSGTGALAGITGTAEFRHDDQGARLSLRYELPPAD